MVARAGHLSVVFGAQALASITNFGVNAIALGSSDVATYGRFAIVFQLCQLTITIAHGAIGEATLIHTSEREDTSILGLRNGAAALAMVVGVAFTGPLLVAAWAVESMRTGLTIAAIGLPFMLPQYVYRAQSFAAGTPGRAFASDATWLGVVAIGALCDLAFWDATPNGHLVVWLAGGAIAGLPATARAISQGRDHLARFVSLAGRQMIRLGAEGIMAKSAIFTALVALQFVGKDVQAGALAAAILLFAPMGVLFSGVASFVIPRQIKRRGVHVVRPTVPLAVSAVLVTICVTWAVLVYAVDSLGFGIGPFDLERNLINDRLYIAVAAHFTASGLWRGPLLALRINDAADQSVRARGLGTAAQLVLPVIGVALSGVTLGAIGLATGTFIGAVDTWRRYLRQRRAVAAGR